MEIFQVGMSAIRALKILKRSVVKIEQLASRS